MKYSVHDLCYGQHISLYQEMKLNITEGKKMYRQIFSSQNLYVHLLESKSQVRKFIS